MKEWSSAWKASKKSKKQRKYRYNAPLHIKKGFSSSNLSKELRQKYKKRNIAVVQGDKVKVVRGQFKGHTGKVDRVDVKKIKIFVSGIEIQKKDGSKTNYGIHPSNLSILEMNLGDKKRNMSLERK